MKNIEKRISEKLEELRVDSINEVKSFDKSHGAKLPHKLISQFFTDVAPKFDSLAAVEQALHALYKKNNIETTTQGVKQVISNYKKRVDLSKQSKVKESIEPYINEKSLSSKEKIERDKLVIQMKKYLKDFKRKYGSDELASIYATATAITKD